MKRYAIPFFVAAVFCGLLLSLWGQQINSNALLNTDISTPSAPSKGTTLTYTKAGTLCALSPAASETCTGASSSGGVIGTASFNPSAGNIGSLVVAGVVSGVTYSGVGHYAVALSPSTSNYMVSVISEASGSLFGLQFILDGTYSSSGFSIGSVEVNGGGFSAWDFPLVLVTVVKM